MGVGQLRLKLGGDGTVTFVAWWGWDSYVCSLVGVGQLRLKLGWGGTVMFEAWWGWDSYV